MGILEILEEKLSQTKNEGRFRDFISIERNVDLAPWALEHSENGIKKINIWCSNDYLSMSHNPYVINEMVTAAKSIGVGSCGARSISGTSVYHTRLESLLTKSYNKEASLLFATDFTANDATLSVIGNSIPDLVIFSDELNHASIISGIRNSKCEKKFLSIMILSI